MGVLSLAEQESGTKLVIYTTKEKELARKLDNVSTFLNSMHDNEAKRILSELEEDIEDTRDDIKARYFNCKGIIALNQGDNILALEHFGKANALLPENEKFITNQLHTELLLSSDLRTEDNLSLACDWEARLETVIRNKPEYVNATKLKALWIAKKKGVNHAQEFLRNSSHWEKEQFEFLGLLSECYLNAGNLDKALTLLEEAESIEPRIPWNIYSLRGLICLKKALGDCKEGETIIRGYGPPKINMNFLFKAKESYEKAIDELASKGYPTQSEIAITNQSLIHTLLGSPEKGYSMCVSYLTQNPNSVAVNSALAGSLIHQGKGDQALRMLRRLTKLTPILNLNTAIIPSASYT
jgi:tetratricopeptide (TPR) repeat protein